MRVGCAFNLEHAMGQSSQPSADYQALLDAYTAPADRLLVEKLPDKAVRCLACAHRCTLSPGQRGICRLRFNQDGELRVPYGYLAGLAVDPVEKKPFFHVLPGRSSLSFGMLGCNFRCDFCQNWQSSQALRDHDACTGLTPNTPEQVLALAQKNGLPALISTYNEPLITSDWALALFEEAHAAGIKCGFVSNGFATPELLSRLLPFMDMFKVDLKCFTAEGYRKLGGRLAPVLDTITRLAASDVWLEVVTLIVPGFNDDEKELSAIAAFLASLSPDIPWHITGFRPQYRYQDADATSADVLTRAWNIGRDEGLHFVYTGNTGLCRQAREHTLCPGCGILLIERQGFFVVRNRLHQGRCPDCSTSIPGLWH